MLKVWVVCCNDFPDSVFSTEAGAEAYKERKRKAARAHQTSHGGMLQHWHVHAFTMDSKND